MNSKWTYSDINNMALAPQEFVDSCAERYRSCVKEAAEIVFNDIDKKIVMLAGPSSSGKTTTASLISAQIELMGGRAYSVSLDDFYRSHDEPYPLNDKGEPDYESVEALDIPLLRRCLGELATQSESDLPVFDFASGVKRDGAKHIALDDNDIIVIEGLHALNPIITDELPEDSLYKIYVSVSSRVYEDDGSVLLSKRELRFIRRTVRDHLFRSMPVERTFGIWSGVKRGEDRFLFPFEELADVRIDSFHPCEPCLMAQTACELFSAAQAPEFREKAALLINKLKLFKNIDTSLLPSDSLLREFTG